MLAVRPHLLHVGPGADHGLSGVIKDVVFLGEAVEYVVQAGAIELMARQNLRSHRLIPTGTAVNVSWDWADTRLL